MAKDDDAQKIGDDTIYQLEQVKKGKSRKFVMICKGTSIVSLFVFKKGSFEKYKKQAKELGRGQIYFGIAGGRGMDIVFQLARADGFEKDPVKPLVLKSLLEESAGFKCKPTFEIVDALGYALDEDDPLVQRYLALRDPTTAAALAAPQAADELNALYRQIGGHFDEEQTDEVQAELKQLEELLANLSTPTSETGKAETETPSGNSKQIDKAEQDWLAAHGKLKVAVLEVVAAGLGDVGKIRAVWAYALEKAEAGDFANTLKAVPGLVQLIKTARESKKSEAEGEIPFNIVPFVQARRKWSETRSKLQEELAKLGTAIEKSLAEAVEKLEAEHDDEFVVVSDVEELFDYVADLDDELETTLEELVETPDGGRREALKGQARAAASRYRQVLSADFFRDVDGNNGFLPVAVSSTAESALEEIEAALA